MLKVFDSGRESLKKDGKALCDTRAKHKKARLRLMAGLARLVNAGSTYQVIDPTGGNVLSPLAGHVIPGISIQAQPACASSSTGADSYVPGSTHTTTSNVTPGGYQLFAQVGAKGLSGNASVGTYKLDLPQPQTATVIDSWAAVIE